MGPSIGSLGGVIYPSLSQVMHSNIYISPREACYVNASISPLRLRPFICKALKVRLTPFMSSHSVSPCVTVQGGHGNMVVFSLYSESISL